jgi:hypothetical protein
MRDRVILLILIAVLIHTSFWTRIPHYSWDSNAYFTLAHRLRGLSWKDACYITYTSQHVKQTWIDSPDVPILRDQTNHCREHTLIYSDRPLYPILLAPMISLYGDVVGPWILSLIVYIIGVVVVYYLLDVVGVRGAFFYSIAYAGFELTTRFSGVLYLSDSLALTLWTTTTYYIVKCMYSNRYVKHLYISMILLALTRPNILLILPATAIAFYKTPTHMIKTIGVGLCALLIPGLILPGYGAIAFYNYSFHTPNQITDIHTTTPPENYLTDHIARVTHIIKMGTLLLLNHLHIYFITTIVGYILYARNQIDYMFFTQIIASFGFYIIYPIPDVRYTIYILPGILYGCGLLTNNLMEVLYDRKQILDYWRYRRVTRIF